MHSIELHEPKQDDIIQFHVSHPPRLRLRKECHALTLDQRNQTYSIAQTKQENGCSKSFFSFVR